MFMINQHEDIGSSEGLKTHLSGTDKKSVLGDHTSVVKASTIIALLTLLVRSMGAIKELSIARVYGRGEDLDTYLGALILPTVMINIFVSSVTVSVVPALIRIRTTDGDLSAHRFVSVLSFYLISFLSILALFLACIAD